MAKARRCAANALGLAAESKAHKVRLLASWSSLSASILLRITLDDEHPAHGSTKSMKLLSTAYAANQNSQ